MGEFPAQGNYTLAHHQTEREREYKTNTDNTKNITSLAEVRNYPMQSFNTPNGSRLIISYQTPGQQICSTVQSGRRKLAILLSFCKGTLSEGLEIDTIIIYKIFYSTYSILLVYLVLQLLTKTLTTKGFLPHL